MKLELITGLILDTDDAKAQHMIACGLAKPIEEQKKAEPKKKATAKKTTKKASK